MINENKMQGLAPTRRTHTERGDSEREGGGKRREGTKTQTHLTGLQECSKDQQCQSHSWSWSWSRSQRQQNDCPLAHLIPSSDPPSLLRPTHSCAACCSFWRQLNSHLFCSPAPLAAFAHTLLILMARGVPGQDNGLARSMAYVSYVYGKQL